MNNAVIRMEQLLEKMGIVDKIPPIIHIAGTNGKGSTLEFSSNILISAGYKVGQFTSPHVRRKNDRIRANNVEIPDEKLDELVAHVQKFLEKGCEYTLFEIFLAVSLVYFCENRCDLVFLETGIGGLLDATNGVPGKILCVITQIASDHTSLLGESLEEIAMQKCGIFRPGVPVVMSVQSFSVCEKIISDEVEKPCTRLYKAKKPEISEVSQGGSRFFYDNMEYNIQMLGSHQVKNACTALEIAKVLTDFNGWKIPENAKKIGLENTRLGRRMELISENPPVYYDGCHNPAGAQVLSETLEMFPARPVGVVGMSKGKDFQKFCEILANNFVEVFCVDEWGSGVQCVPARELAEIFTKCGTNAQCNNYQKGLEKARERAKEMETSVILCGSLYF